MVDIFRPLVQTIEYPIINDFFIYALESGSFGVAYYRLFNLNKTSFELLLWTWNLSGILIAEIILSLIKNLRIKLRIHHPPNDFILFWEWTYFVGAPIFLQQFVVDDSWLDRID